MTGGLRGVLLMVRRSLRQHALSTLVTLMAVGLASGLTMAVFSIQEQSMGAFSGNQGFDAVLGARGSELQLVLNTVFHLETSPGNIPWSLYEDIKNDRRVKLAVPYATGDNYYGFRVIGTTPEVFTEFEYQEGKQYKIAEGGRAFEPGYAEATIGSYVARETGLGVGDTFSPFHGVRFDPTKEHSENVYTVVGVMEATNTPADRVVYIPIEGIYWMGGHVLRGTGEVFTPRGGEAIPDEHKEVSAVMIKFRDPTGGLSMAAQVNQQGKVATLAFPIGKVMADLFNKIGWVNRIFEGVTYLVVLVSAATILASIYNTINERRREFAILRALGARRRTVFTAIVMESAAIAFLGAVVGFAVYAVILAIAYVFVQRSTGVVLDVTEFHPALIFVPLGMTLLGAISGVVPAIRAYTTDVAENLVPQS